MTSDSEVTLKPKLSQASAIVVTIVEMKNWFFKDFIEARNNLILDNIIICNDANLSKTVDNFCL